MSWVTLQMGDHRCMEDLAPDSEGFDTGWMTYCQTIILLWDAEAVTGRFRNGRGLHCLGGYRYVFPDASCDAARTFFRGVPDHPATRVILIGPVFNSATQYDVSHERTETNALLAELLGAHLRHARRETYGLGRARVDRKGIVLDTTTLAARPAWGADAKGKRKPPPGCCIIL